MSRISITMRAASTVVVVAALFSVGVESGVAQTPDAATAASDYGSSVYPLLQKYCFECHSGDRIEADIDLAPFTSVEAVDRRVDVWIKVREMLDTRQMPPKDSPQPSDEQFRQLSGWVRGMLARHARATAGDPGPVVLRRLNNDEYNYTVRDLTGVDRLNPTLEFPVDGAAGEGFTNAGSAQSMSPALVTKYLDAGKEVASHVVLLPEGIRFSPYTTRRDQTDELLARIQDFYRRFTQDGGGTAVNLQGIKFDTNQGGLLPLDRYLSTILENRDDLASGAVTPDTLAAQRGLSPRYLQSLWQTLASDDPLNSLLLETLRQRWQQADNDGVAALAHDIRAAQSALWKFNSVGQLTEGGRQKTWMEPVNPVVTRQEIRVPFDGSTADVVDFHLVAAAAAGAGDQTFVIWERPRIEFKAEGETAPHPPILLKDALGLVEAIRELQKAELPRTAQYLAAVSALRSGGTTLEDTAASAGLNAGILKHWSETVGFGQRQRREIQGVFTTQLLKAQGYDAVNGWGSDQTPNMLTNRSDQDVSFLTLTVPARGVVMHPSPDRESFVTWKAPLDARVTIKGLVADADNKCGNGSAWRLQIVQETGTTVLVNGVIDNGGRQPFEVADAVNVRSGDLLTLVVNSRDNNHSCDTTHVELQIDDTAAANGTHRWNLASDVVEAIVSANPLADQFGHDGVWHFGAAGAQQQPQSSVPAGSALAAWRSAVIDGQSNEELQRLASAVATALTQDSDEGLSDADQLMRSLMRDWKGPLRWITVAADRDISADGNDATPSLFGRLPGGGTVDEFSVCVQAPDVVTVRIPGELAAGGELVTTATVHASSDERSVVHASIRRQRPDAPRLPLEGPFLVRDGSSAQQHVVKSLDDFRSLFPSALCYARIVPVDEVVTMTLFFREDDQLKRLMLNDEQSAELDALWDELLYVAQEPIALTVAFEQILEFATQDRPDLVTVFTPMREPINKRADEFRVRLRASEPSHVAAVLDLADRAWRRPLEASERQQLQDLYQQLRSADVAHSDAVQLLIARVVTSPAFLFRRELPVEGTAPGRVAAQELAIRLSYFLWSSTPDGELQRAVQAGRLTTADDIRAQTGRMLNDARTRRLAVQFACQWLHLRDFDHNDDKNEALYPEFEERRADMYEETVRFFEDMFRNDGSILDLLDADHTFVNGPLASHYGIASVAGDQWRRVDNVREMGRGGVLGMATFLASQSGASRTSPILRGNWISETLLGERLPRPPANVPVLPEEVPEGLTARELIERHSSVPACAKCHMRIDPYGFALEQFDAIGRTRPDKANTRTTLMDGREIEGLDGLRKYLTMDRRDDVVRQFCRKLLGYALGRSVQLSDEPLLDAMLVRLRDNDYRFHIAVDSIVQSPQFQTIRGQDYVDQEHQ